MGKIRQYTDCKLHNYLLDNWSVKTEASKQTKLKHPFKRVPYVDEYI